MKEQVVILIQNNIFYLWGGFLGAVVFLIRYNDKITFKKLIGIIITSIAVGFAGSTILTFFFDFNNNLLIAVSFFIGYLSDRILEELKEIVGIADKIITSKLSKMQGRRNDNDKDPEPEDF